MTDTVKVSMDGGWRWAYGDNRDKSVKDERMEELKAIAEKTDKNLLINKNTHVADNAVNKPKSSLGSFFHKVADNFLINAASCIRKSRNNLTTATITGAIILGSTYAVMPQEMEERLKNVFENSATITNVLLNSPRPIARPNPPLQASMRPVARP